MYNKPIKLISSRAWRTYLGGKLIYELHGEKGEDSNFPEEWLMSTVSARNSGREHIVEGISFVSDSNLTLCDIIRQHPKELLGEKHLEKYGENLGVLLKLLDSAERLTIQVHPTKKTAKKLFNSAFGKTECWHIIDEREIGGEKPCIYIGFKEGITLEHWKKCFDNQDIPEMLNCLHKIEVKKGDTFIIRGGVPHGIGAGCFLVEIQEPTDYTIRTERTTPSGLKVSDFMCHQGSGFEKMFECFEYNGLPLEETIKKYKVEPKLEQFESYSVNHIIYPEITHMFALDIIEVTDLCDLYSNGDFSGIYVMQGEGTINGIKLEKCDHYFIPACCDKVVIKKDGIEPLKIIRCFGPKA